MYLMYYIISMRMLILIFTVWSLLFALPLAAQEYNHNAPDKHFPPSGLFHLYLGVNMATSEYTEPDIGVTHNAIYFPGLVAKIAMENPDKIPVFASLRYRYQNGTYNYNGYLQDLSGRRTSYSETALPVAKYDAEFLAGALNGRFRAFAGVQYENYMDNGYTINRNFYKRTRESVYGVLGVGAKHHWENYRSLELVLKAKSLVKGTHESRMSDLGGVWKGAGTISKDQSDVLRFEVSAEYQYEMLWIEPYFSHTQISATKDATFTLSNGTTGRISEPANTTVEFGINIGIRF